MGVVDTAGDPFLHHETAQIIGVAAQVERRDFQDDCFESIDILGEIDVAAAAGVQGAQDSITLEHRARFQQRRKLPFQRLIKDFGGVAVGQFVDAEDLDG